MPLAQGYSAASFEKNLRQLHSDGAPPRQAIAIAYSIARKALDAAGLKETRARESGWHHAIARAFKKAEKKR